MAQPTEGKPFAVRELHFTDRADGGITVSDAAAGDRVVDIVKPETGYFLRATLRGLAHQRQARGSRRGPAIPPDRLARRPAYAG